MRDIMLEREEDEPLYQQLARSLREHIDKGGIEVGGMLPSEREICETIGMSRVTVRKGIERLIQEGVVVRKQGAGTFVTRRIEAAGSIITSFSEDARSRGEAPAAVWMVKTYAQPTEEESQALEIPATSRVARLARVRLSGGEPLAIEHAVVPAIFLPDLDAIKESLYAALDREGFAPVSGTQRVRASLATPTDAGILCIQQNSEVMRTERLTRIADGRPVELTRSVYRGDRYDFVTDLKVVR